MIGDGFHAENVGGMLINRQDIFLTHALGHTAVELIEQKDGVGPVGFFIAAHRRIVNRIGLPHPLLSHGFTLVETVLGPILLVVIGHELSIFLIVRLDHIPNVFNQPEGSLFEFLVRNLRIDGFFGFFGGRAKTGDGQEQEQPNTVVPAKM